MAPEEVVALCARVKEKYGWNDRDLAKALGLRSPQTIRRWRTNPALASFKPASARCVLLLELFASEGVAIGK